MNDKASTSGQCPSRTVLEKLISGSLSGREATSLERHISGCRLCQTSLDSAVPDELAATAKRALSSPDRIATALSAILADAEADIQESVSKSTPAGGITRSDVVSKPAGWADLKPWLTPTEDGSIGQLGPYRLTEILGRGGMGIVFRSQDPQLNRPVAIKVLSPGLLADDIARERFLREARAVAAINHPGIVGIYEVVSDAELPYFAMEFVDGRSLESLVSSGRKFSAREVTRIGYSVANALAAAHAAGLIHRDIKPANILIESKTGRVRLMDFGLARNSTGSNLTGSGALLGTPSYMAPETIAEQPQDERTDLFSLGGVMYHLLTGQAPFEASTVIGTVQAVSRGRYRPIQQLAPGAPVSLQKIVGRLLAHKPDDRFPSASDAANAFKASRRNDSNAIEKRKPSGTSKRLAVGLAALGSAVLMAVLVQAFFRSQPDGSDKGNASSSPAEPAHPVTVANETSHHGHESPPMAGKLPETRPFLEHSPTGVSAKTQVTAAAEIVCLNSAGDIVAEPDSLDLAVRLVPDGGVIKLPAKRVRISESLDIGVRAIEISGPDGERADLVGDFDEADPMFITGRSLTLRNINLEFTSDDDDSDDLQVVAQESGRLECSNCRFRADHGTIINVDAAEVATFQECTFTIPDGCAIRWSTDVRGGKLVIKDCLMLTDIGIAAEQTLPESLSVVDSGFLNQTFLSIEFFEDTYPLVSRISVAASTFLAMESVIRIETESDLENVTQGLQEFSWNSSFAIYSPTIVDLFEVDEDEPLESLGLEEWNALPSVKETHSRSLRWNEIEGVDELIDDFGESNSELGIRQFMKSVRTVP